MGGNVLSLGYFLHVLIVFILPHSESFSFTKKPPRTVRVLEGASKNLTWGFTASASQYFVTLSFRRLKIGDTRQEQIAARNQDNAFNYAKDSYKNDYTAFLPAKLLLKKVKRNEKYVYTIRILNEIVQEQLKDEVTVEVVVPPKITIAPAREARLNTGQTYNLTCNAAGDPHPSITWTKDGVPANQFNMHGYLLQLVNVHFP
ncbi:uncharacterized protein LOC144663157 [Oculina patagonica]